MRNILIQYGVDWDRTMGRFLYDEALYLECLELLAQDPSPGALKNALDRGNLSAAFDAAHTLKGVAANMGLEPLFRAVCEIVEPLRARQDIDYGPLMGALERELRRVDDLLCALKTR